MSSLVGLRKKEKVDVIGQFGVQVANRLLRILSAYVTGLLRGDTLNLGSMRIIKFGN
ncbi:unnamed protein product [Dovyalis caffra]|uniref:Uncharacterized protein n=1 Tax=Dovyalis caffra TaxID=77055 RepID=A0AAV1SBL8_9ROSI|nr:unnamed protein product [Dovyalis caffra]